MDSSFFKDEVLPKGFIGDPDISPFLLVFNYHHETSLVRYIFNFRTLSVDHFAGQRDYLRRIPITRFLRRQEVPGVRGFFWAYPLLPF